MKLLPFKKLNPLIIIPLVLAVLILVFFIFGGFHFFVRVNGIPLNPEEKRLLNTLVQSYPNEKITMSSSYGPSENPTVKGYAKQLNISLIRDSFLTGKEMQKIGQKACTLLKQDNVMYDNVSITTVIITSNNFFFHFNKTFNIVGTCNEWFTDPIIPTILPPS